MADPSPFHSEVVSDWLDKQRLPSAIRRIAEALLLGYTLYAANVALANKPDQGWRALQQLAKDGPQARHFASRNRMTCAVLDLYNVAYDTPAARQAIIAAWAIAEPRIAEGRRAGWLVAAELLNFTSAPAVTYNGLPVEKIYRDPAYAEGDQRYVIKLGSCSVGGKRPQALLRRV